MLLQNDDEYTIWLLDDQRVLIQTLIGSWISE